MSNVPQAGSSSHRIVRRFAALCERATVPPTVSRFLAAYPQATPRQRVDVILIDIVRRWSNGHFVSVEEYLADDAEVAADPALSLELIVAEYDTRSKLGLQPTVEEYVERFPGIGESIQQKLSEHCDANSLPNYSGFVRHVLEDGLTPGTVWAGRLNSATRFGPNRLLNRVSQTESGCFLSGCKPFSLLPAPVVKLIESSMEVANFDVGEHLIRQHAPGDSLMVLCDGDVEISTCDDEGTRRVIAQTGRTQVLGEMALLTGEPRNADVVALSPVRALLLPAERFHELAGRYPEISEMLTLLLAERLGTPGQDDVLAGKKLDEYRVCRRLGRGGMAVVYEARHVETNQHVALKMMSHRLVYDDEALAQFQTEADIIQSVDHENIIKLFGRFSAFHTGFIVMEFVDGNSLNEMIDRSGPLSPDNFRKAFGQIARAVRCAHQAGVIHRDIKPANIMVARDGLMKLMDFGLATPALNTTIAYGKVMGTPRYMAPEQLVGGRLTTAADIFSLGCVGYELLTGEPLNVDDNVIELLRRHSNWEIPTLQREYPQLDPESCRVVEQCLHVDPDQRQLDFDRVTEWAAPIDMPTASNK